MNIPAVVERLAHRYPSLLVDAVTAHEPGRRILAVKNVTVSEEFFQGHFPGMPLMPGVLMIEGAAQTATFLIKKVVGWEVTQFVGLGGLNDVRFRGQVVPPARVYFIAGPGNVSGRRLARFPAQAFCNGQMVMEMELLGVLL